MSDRFSDTTSVHNGQEQIFVGIAGTSSANENSNQQVIPHRSQQVTSFGPVQANGHGHLIRSASSLNGLTIDGTQPLRLVQVGNINWIGGRVPNDLPWGDPDLPQMAVVFAALAAFIFVLVVAFLLIHRWIKANTFAGTPPDEDTLEDALKDAASAALDGPTSHYTYRSTSPSHVRYTLLNSTDRAYSPYLH